MTHEDRSYLESLRMMQNTIGSIIPIIFVVGFFVVAFLAAFAGNALIKDRLLLVLKYARTTGIVVWLGWLGHLVFEFMIRVYERQIEIKERMDAIEKKK